MKTILKWPGGKEKELPIIRKFIPDYSGRFVEPFVGGGAVFFDTATPHCYINDKSAELINLYKCIEKKDADFLKYLQNEIESFALLSDFVDNHSKEILDLYHSILPIDDFINKYNAFFLSLSDDYSSVFLKEIKKNLTNKIERSKKLETKKGEIPDKDRIDNIEAALKSAYYMLIRYIQNNPSQISDGRQAAVFFFIREYCYSSMFRYNSNGEFNVPYGGISYNRKDIKKKLDYILSDEIHDKLSAAKIYCEDFETFINMLELTDNDFVFLDPPYDSDFSTYAKNEFGQAEQIRLCKCLTETKAKILLVIKNTDFIYDLYKNKFNITSFDKKYMVSFMNRNDRKAEHLIITNY